MIQDPQARADLRDLARSFNRLAILERGEEIEARALEVIRSLWVLPESRVSIQDITQSFISRFSQEYDRKITPKYIGSLIRHKLNIQTVKVNGVYVIPPSEEPTLRRLYARYGVEDTPAAEIQPNPSSPQFPEDLTPPS